MSWTSPGDSRQPKVNNSQFSRDSYSAPDDAEGIWMCRGKDTNVMVLDVEGTDGRERGEDQVCDVLRLLERRSDCMWKQEFERKAALFSLASSEVLIVNMWEHQVVLYQGANMSLLKTVFEVNLALFGKMPHDGYVAPFLVSSCQCNPLQHLVPHSPLLRYPGPHRYAPAKSAVYPYRGPPQNLGHSRQAARPRA